MGYAAIRKRFTDGTMTLQDAGHLLEPSMLGDESVEMPLFAAKEALLDARLVRTMRKRNDDLRAKIAQLTGSNPDIRASRELNNHLGGLQAYIGHTIETIAPFVDS